jgi:hypothetical protein
MSIVDVCLRAPARGLGLLGPYLVKAELQDDIGRLMSRFAPGYLPDSIMLERSGMYWTGYWHQRAANYLPGRAMTPEELQAAGEALFGARWQSDMAEALGLHDSARIRSWLRGDRPVPRGVIAEVIAIARQREVLAAEIADQLEKIFSRQEPRAAKEL